MPEVEIYGYLQSTYVRTARMVCLEKGEPHAGVAGVMDPNTEFHEAYNQVVARYYDAAYEMALASGADQAFYAELAVESGGPVLELGCGTGRVLLEVSRRGIECVGIDSSQAMLARLTERAAGRPPELFWGQMQAFDLGRRRFSLIYSAFRPFQHLYDVGDQIACLERVLTHLEPGGRFAFDVFNPKPESWGEPLVPERGDLRFELDGDEVLRYVSIRRDPVRQLAEAQMRFETRREGVVVKNETELIRMRWFTRFELEHLLARAGFERVVIYGDFDRSPVESGSPELVVLAHKPG